MQVNGAPIAFSPGFRWGTTLLPGEAITREHLMDQAAITYPMATVNEISGAQIKVILEDVADNLFNPDPYYQQGGDMVRVGGLTYACDPRAKMGQRISDLRLAGLPLEADKRYRVAGWAPVAEGATGEPVWDVVERWLKEHKVVSPPSAQPAEADRCDSQLRVFPDKWASFLHRRRHAPTIRRRGRPERARRVGHLQAVSRERPGLHRPNAAQAAV
jgi:2',3'-cyclic-nucleotide 2'-phosphodiesterase (5'-nucleotidase family)